MAELYATGVSRILYKAEGFATGKTVTGYFWNPSLTKSALQTFTELEQGLYYLDYDFTVTGTYLSLFYENSVAKASGVFRVTALNDISVANIIAGIADGSYDLQEMLRLMFAALVGKSSGGGSDTLKFRNSADNKNRISATVDSNGNRTAVTLDGS